MENPASTPLAKPHVLLVEDSRVDAAIVKAMLTESGDLDVTGVSTFQEAMWALMEKPYDAVVLDLNLPDSKGEESMMALKKKFPRLPVIVLSSQSEEVMRLRRGYGAEGFLTKDQADNGEILKAIFRKTSHKPAG